MTEPGPGLLSADRPDGALAALPGALGRCGYADVAASFFPWTVSPASWQEAAELLDDPLRAAVRLFLLGGTVPADRLPGEIAGLLPALASAGVATVRTGPDGEEASLRGLGLFLASGVWLFAQLPQMSPTLYFGDDSVALASRVEVRRGTCLDLCAGPGLQALVSASRGMRVVAVEVNPVAAALCAVNAELNGLAGRVEVRCADLWTGAGDRRYDLVTANPPLLPIPAGFPYPFVGDGGPDGLAVTWRILRGLPDHLAGGGVAQLIGMTLSDGFVPLPLDDVGRWAEAAGMDVTWTIVEHLPTTADGWWVRGVAATVAEQEAPGSGGSPGDADDPGDPRRAALAEGYAALGAPCVCTYFLRVTPGTGRLRYVDVSPRRQAGGLWFR